MIALTYAVKSGELCQVFKMSEMIKMVKDGEYDPEKEVLTLDFNEVQIHKIAEAQLKLLKKDLAREQGKSRTHQYFISAYEFIQKPEFLNVCMEYGLSRETSEYQAKWLKLRYSVAFENALSGAVDGEVIKGDITKSARFAYELASHLFEISKTTRKLVHFEKRYITGTDYWARLSSQGVRSYACKQMLSELWLANNDKHNNY